MKENIKTKENPFLFDETDTIDNYDAKVFLFNDEEHSFDEVIDQLILAIKCSKEKAYLLTMQVHKSGYAKVFSGEYNACIKVSNILQEINLTTTIEI